MNTSKESWAIAPLSPLPAKVRLMERPDGRASQYAPVTVGAVYDVQDRMGSCLVVSTDVPGETTSLFHGRFTPA